MWERVVGFRVLHTNAVSERGGLGVFSLCERVEKNGLMSRFFALFWQNFASRASLKKATSHVPADI